MIVWRNISFDEIHNFYVRENTFKRDNDSKSSKANHLDWLRFVFLNDFFWCSFFLRLTNFLNTKCEKMSLKLPYCVIGWMELNVIFNLDFSFDQCAITDCS